MIADHRSPETTENWRYCRNGWISKGLRDYCAFAPDFEAEVNAADFDTVEGATQRRKSGSERNV